MIPDQVASVCEALPEWMLHIFSSQNMRKSPCGIFNNNTRGPLQRPITIGLMMLLLLIILCACFSIEVPLDRAAFYKSSCLWRGHCETATTNSRRVISGSGQLLQCVPSEDCNGNVCFHPPFPKLQLGLANQLVCSARAPRWFDNTPHRLNLILSKILLRKHNSSSCYHHVAVQLG